MRQRETILIIDDKPNIREVLSAILNNEGYRVITSVNGEDALNLIRATLPDLIVTDLKMPGMDGIEFVRKVNAISSFIPIIIITAFGTISSAVEAMKAGAYDYLTKPLDYDRFKILIERALDQKKISSENIQLKEVLKNEYSFDNIIGKSPAMQKLFSLIKTVASSNCNILIQGESGTGKELIARAIHYNSPRKDRSLITVDCSAIPEGLLESELFGHEKGAFTGAVCAKKGRVELADGGTLFLDEIGEMTLPLQAKLLRVLQEKQFVRVGGLENIKIDFRLIASTNRDLKTEVSKGNFRSDLYYRLNVINIYVPPLRERKEDIPLLVEYFLKKFSSRDGKMQVTVSPEVMNYLIQYDWRGNVRELENCIERMLVVTQTDIITTEYLPEEILDARGKNKNTGDNRDTFNLEQIEKETILKALEKTNWNKSKAAKLLNIDRKALYNRLKKYSIPLPE